MLALMWFLTHLHAYVAAVWTTLWRVVYCATTKSNAAETATQDV